MNKRLSNKLKDQFRDNKLIARKSCFYCINWGFGCANGHPNVYPGDNSDYLYGCKKRLDACKFLAKQLKNEKFALSGWQLTEIPAMFMFLKIKRSIKILQLYMMKKKCAIKYILQICFENIQKNIICINMIL